MPSPTKRRFRNKLTQQLQSEDDQPLMIDKFSDMWVSVDVVVHEDDTEALEVQPTEQWTSELWTGLHDSRGVEICEHDVVLIHPYAPYAPYTAAVTWFNTGLGLDMSTVAVAGEGMAPARMQSLAKVAKRAVIVGDVYQPAGEVIERARAILEAMKEGKNNV